MRDSITGNNFLKKALDSLKLTGSSLFLKMASDPPSSALGNSGNLPVASLTKKAKIMFHNSTKTMNWLVCAYRPCLYKPLSNLILHLFLHIWAFCLSQFVFDSDKSLWMNDIISSFKYGGGIRMNYTGSDIRFGSLFHTAPELTFAYPQSFWPVLWDHASRLSWTLPEAPFHIKFTKSSYCY